MNRRDRSHPRRAPAHSLLRYLQRLIGWCMLPLALSLAAAAAALMVMVHEKQVAFAQRRVLGMAVEVDSNLSRHIQGLKTLAAASVTPTANPSLARLHADAVAYQQAAGFPVLLTDADRRIWVSSARPLGEPLPPLPKPPGPTALDTAFETGQPRVGNVVQGPILNRPVIPIIMPVPELPGTKAWLTSLPIDLWQRRLEKETIAAGWNVMLIDANGQMIAGVGPSLPDLSRPDFNGVRFTARSQIASWTAVAGANRWTFYQPLLRMSAVLALILGAVTLIAFWLVRHSTHRINRAVQQLTDTDETKGLTPSAANTTLSITEIDAVHQELHDGLQQNLAALKLLVDTARRRPDQPPDSAAILSQASQGAQLAMTELHHIVNDLRPLALDELGLATAVTQHAQSVSRLTGLLIEVESIGDTDLLHALPAALSDSLFRVVQEGLANVRKHVQASFVLITIDFTRPDRLVLQVSDDGVGFEGELPTRPESFGLVSMRQRIMALGGHFQVRRGHPDDPACGTTIQATVPVNGLIEA